MIQHGNEHRRNTVHRRTPFALNRAHDLKWIEMIDQYHRRRMRICGHDAQNAAEAMEKRYWDTQPVFMRELHAVADRHSVVDQIVMRQHNAFGEACGPGRILHIDHIVYIQLFFPCSQFLRAHLICKSKNVVVED